MDWFVDNWPVILVVLAVAIVLMGIAQRLVRLAFFGAVLGVIGLVIWPMIS